MHARITYTPLDVHEDDFFGLDLLEASNVSAIYVQVGHAFQDEFYVDVSQDGNDWVCKCNYGLNILYELLRMPKLAIGKSQLYLKKQASLMRTWYCSVFILCLPNITLGLRMLLLFKICTI